MKNKTPKGTYGICASCKQEFALNADGRVRWHDQNGAKCLGSHREPQLHPIDAALVREMAHPW